MLRVGMEPEAPPLHFINARKQEDGFDFRLSGIIAEGLGAKRVQVVEADYDVPFQGHVSLGPAHAMADPFMGWAGRALRPPRL